MIKALGKFLFGAAVTVLIMLFSGVPVFKHYSQYTPEDLVSFQQFIVIYATLGLWGWVDTIFRKDK